MRSSIEDHLTEGRRSVLLSRERPAGHCPHLLADACQGPLQDIDAATAAVAIERVLVGCDRRHLYAAQERRDRGEPMTSEDLQAHYRTELARMLGPEGGRYVNPKTTAWMLKHTAATEGGTYTPETGARTWIWSDLHLHHKNIIRYCNRPFQSVEAMNEALLAAWKETVGEADTIICGGDIALAGALKRERLARVRAMPGRKLLVRGNHDFGRNGRPADTGSDATWMTMVITGNPTLLVTHIAMNEVPDGTVNLYGRTCAQQRAVAGGTVREHVCRVRPATELEPAPDATSSPAQPVRPPSTGGAVHDALATGFPRPSDAAVALKMWDSSGVEHTEYRPLPLDAVRRLALARLDDPRPRAATTAEEIRCLDR